MTLVKLLLTLIWSSNDPAAESAVIHGLSCVWAFALRDEWSTTAAMTS